MRRPGGYAIATGPSGPVLECDTFTCAHCNRVVFVRPKSDAAGFCRLCMKAICHGCEKKGECSPFERKLEAMESQRRFREQIG